ncbi:MAG: ribonuclease III [Bacteroidetes bacterium]|nr:ribonuclease III [Bacteroidota bacterium]
MGRLTSRLLNYISGSKPLVLQLEHILGFRPVHLPYYELALMHRSKIDDHNQNNERLEFLGDAILGSIVAEYLFKKYPNQQEGFLTEMRSRIVRRETLNNVALRMGLNKLVQFNQNDRGLGRSHIFGNALEALIGAVYLDIGFTRTRTFILRQIIKTYIDLDQIEATDTNYKNQLLSWAQRNAHSLSFETIEEKQEGSRKVFSVGILLNGKLLTIGNGYTKKDAGQVAAQKALEQIKTPLE